MKTYIIAIVALVIICTATAGAVVYFSSQSVDEPILCTQDVKLCPDGSYVSRQGPNCEFAKCPDIIMGTVKGKVTVGPICPVEREGVPCPVPPDAYTSREVILYASDGITVVKSMHFFADGTYFFNVTPGTYVLNIPRQGIGGSGDLPKTVTVKPGEMIEFNFSIDTGIR